MNVLDEIKYMPGNFKYLGYTDDYFVEQLEKDYRIIDNIGPTAWSFLKNYDNFILEANRKDKMYKLIYNSLYKNRNIKFSICINIMCYIAKYGWENYIQNPWVYKTN